MEEDELSPRNLETAKHDRVTELFPYELPFRVSRVVATLIIALFATVVVGAILIDLPESVRARFTLTPEGGMNPIQSSFAGVVAEPPVEEGAEVAEGDVLFAIRSREVQSWQTEWIQLDEDLIEIKDRQEASAKVHESKVLALESQVRQFESELQYHENYRARYQEVLGKIRELNRSGVVSPLEVLNYELGLAAAERDVATAKLTLEQTKLDQRILQTQRDAEIVSERIERNKTEVRLDALDELLANAERDVVYLKAPYSGMVLSVSVKRQGDVVEVGQELCQIARSDSRPRARLTVAQEGVPRLEVGQPVKLYFDAFPYQRYGTVKGRLAWLSPAAVVSSSGREFVAIVQPNAYAIPANGDLALLRVGMEGEARIAVGKRTLIEYAFEPLRKLRENLSQREEVGLGGAAPASDIAGSSVAKPLETDGAGQTGEDE